MLNNREWATLGWLLVAFAGVLCMRTVRPQLGAVLKMLLHPKLLFPILTVVGWLSAVVWGAFRVGLWTPALLGDTVVAGAWSVYLIFAFERAVKEERFTRKVVLSTLRVTVFIEDFVNLRTFPLWIEVVAQPLLLVVLLVGMVAERNPEHEPVKRFTDGVLSVVGLTALAAVGVRLATEWRDIGGDEARAFALPVWMVAASVPALYLVWLYAAYDGVFTWIDFIPDSDERPPWRVRFRGKLAVMLAFRGSIRSAGAFPKYGGRRVREAASLREAVRIARSIRDERLGSVG